MHLPGRLPRTMAAVTAQVGTRWPICQVLLQVVGERPLLA